MRKQIEALEHHPDRSALRGDVLVVHLVQTVAALPVADQIAGDPDAAGVDLLQVVDAAQERRLART